MEKSIDFNDWLTLDQAWLKESLDREDIKAEELCSYGVVPLDDALFRIGKNELVVIGADTGSGKSELGLSIALHNAKAGKTVGVYYLEGGYQEALQRIKWHEITHRYYNDERFYKLHIDMDFKKWAFNSYTAEDGLAILQQIEAEAKADIEKYKENLYFFPVSTNFTLDNLMASLLDFQEWVEKKMYLDLIVIDHLQYFSLEKEENEITEITKILRAVKQITEHYQTPIILISHLRKRGKFKNGLPDHEDFYGSSNIPKISTTAIMIAPATDKDILAENIYPTYIRIVKSRTGARPNYAMLANYYLNERKYGGEYDIYRVNSLGEVFETPLLSNELPKWAVNARRRYTDEQTTPIRDD